MIDFLILQRDWGKETGVTVSTKHLCNLMRLKGFTFKSLSYVSDEHLLKIVQEVDSRVILFQTPSFKQTTLEKVLKLNRETNMVLHSTIAYMQVEEDIFNRAIDFMTLEYPNWSISNPSESQIKGFAAYLPVDVFHLPNTYNPFEDVFESVTLNQDQSHDYFPSESVLKHIRTKPSTISIFCALRPFKNLTTQVTAAAIASQSIDLELHLLESTHPSPIGKYVRRITDRAKFKTVWHQPCLNDKILKIIKNMSLGMQISYTETFSYVLFEHMINGIPTIGSSAIPFASKIARFNDPVDIADTIINLLSDEEKYIKEAEKAFMTALKIKQKNNEKTLQTLNHLLNQSKRRN